MLLSKGVCRDCYWNVDNVISSLRNLDINSYTKTNELLNSILGRPKNEKPFLILAIGYKDENCELPAIKRKEFKEISDVF